MHIAKWDEDSMDFLVERDIGMVGRKRKTTKKEETEEDSDILKTCKKELEDLKKLHTKQNEFIKTLTSNIAALYELHRDSATRMEQDTLDDVYSINYIAAEFKKLQTSINKFLPKEEIANG